MTVKKITLTLTAAGYSYDIQMAAGNHHIVDVAVDDTGLPATDYALGTLSGLSPALVAELNGDLLEPSRICVALRDPVAPMIVDYRDLPEGALFRMPENDRLTMRKCRRGSGWYQELRLPSGQFHPSVMEFSPESRVQVLRLPVGGAHGA